MDESLYIRPAKKSDIHSIYQLIKELAIYEHAVHELTNTPEAIEQDGFGPYPAFECIVAEYHNKIIGMALWYVRYSTWKGKTLYLEDIVVQEHFRNQKVGERLFKAIVKTAKDSNFNSINWQVLDWNQPAIQFYKKWNAEFAEEWLNVRLLPHQFDIIIQD